MAIIRDNDCGGLMMTPLLAQWRVRRCNIEGCTRKPTTIITGDDAQGAGMFGLCEMHWIELSAEPGTTRITLDFGDFNAFGHKGDQG